ncbi:MAG: hypothetical protein R2878_02175 [Thermoleophilia bacterium]
MQRILRLGGVIAGVILIAFGIGSIVLGMNARDTVSTELSRENIVGTPDMNPADTKTALEEANLTDVSAPSCDVAGKPINSGDEARCFASYMRIHALESSGGLTYAEMGRFALASNPADPKGTNDAEAAAKNADGSPQTNGPRQTWVTETALATALNVSYMAEQLGLYTIVIGIALLLTGVGLIIVALGLIDRFPAKTES